MCGGREAFDGSAVGQRVGAFVEAGRARLVGGALETRVCEGVWGRDALGAAECLAGMWSSTDGKQSLLHGQACGLGLLAESDWPHRQ